MKYFLVVVLVVVFMILYVWQNVGMMELKIEIRDDLRREMSLIKKNDRLKYEIERYKNMRVVEQFAESRGMKHITPNDFDTIIIP